MKFYAQFYAMSTGYIEGSIPPRFDDAHKRPIEATGDRGVIVLDGRMTVNKMHAIAADEAKKRGYLGYVIRRADSFLSQPYWSSPYMDVTKLTNRQTISERINARIKE